MSPPSLTANDSTDSLGNLESPMQGGSVSAREMARNNRVREIMETERKYVQELEHMQVCGTLFSLMLKLITLCLLTEIRSCA